MTTAVEPARLTAPPSPTWSAAELAAIDALRGVERGAIVTDDFDGGIEQVSVVTAHGIVVLTSWTEDVAAPVRFVVDLTIAQIRPDLGLGPIAVRYFTSPRWVADEEIVVHEVNTTHPVFEDRAPDGHARLLGGKTSPLLPMTICINAGLRGNNLLRTVAHEMRHAAQLWGSLDVPHDDRERDATAFADVWMAAR